MYSKCTPPLEDQTSDDPKFLVVVPKHGHGEKKQRNHHPHILRRSHGQCPGTSHRLQVSLSTSVPKQNQCPEALTHTVREDPRHVSQWRRQYPRYNIEHGPSERGLIHRDDQQPFVLHQVRYLLQTLRNSDIAPRRRSPSRKIENGLARRSRIFFALVASHYTSVAVLGLLSPFPSFSRWVLMSDLTHSLSQTPVLPGTIRDMHAHSPIFFTRAPSSTDCLLRSRSKQSSDIMLS